MLFTPDEKYISPPIFYYFFEFQIIYQKENNNNNFINLFSLHEQFKIIIKDSINDSINVISKFK